tara:strand:- start:176 stop:418 length:243 start_codon:yes stop_codon:yes gene_type:complete
MTWFYFAKEKLNLFTILFVYVYRLIVKLIQWHKSFVERAQKEMGISNYALYWFGFLEGALVMWIIMKVISVFRVKSEFPF